MIFITNIDIDNPSKNFNLFKFIIESLHVIIEWKGRRQPPLIVIYLTMMIVRRRLTLVSIVFTICKE